MTRRHAFVLAAAALAAFPLVSEAAFMGPSQSPPNGNVPGVIWNKSTSGGSANEQAATEMNIAGSGRFGGDIILGDTKALRIDSVGAATFNVGNWGNGLQSLTVNVFGDIVAQPANASEGRITAPKFCLGVDCITSWPVVSGGPTITSIVPGTGMTGGGDSGAVTVGFDETYGDGRYVNVLGDTMIGTLTLKTDPINPLEAATKQYVDAANGTKLGLSGGTMNGPLIVSGDPDVFNPNSVVNMNYFTSILTPISNNQFLFVKKAGDTMSGGLQITGKDPVYGRGLNVTDATANAGVWANGVIGVQGNGTSYGFYAGGTPTIGINVPLATDYGGVFSARYGVVGGGNAAGFGGQFTNAVVGNSATLGLSDRGGDFTGLAFGVTARSPGLAGQFTNANTPTNIAKLGGAVYAGEFDSAVGTTSLYAQRNALVGGTLTVNGDISAPTNALANCAWTGYVADLSIVQCPAANPIMSGMQRGAGTTRIYCCQL